MTGLDSRGYKIVSSTGWPIPSSKKHLLDLDLTNLAVYESVRAYEIFAWAADDRPAEYRHSWVRERTLGLFFFYVECGSDRASRRRHRLQL